MLPNGASDISKSYRARDITYKYILLNYIKIIH